jgi:hypothetical protein
MVAQDLSGLARQLYERAFCEGLLGDAPQTWDVAEPDYKECWARVVARLATPRQPMMIEGEANGTDSDN